MLTLQELTRVIAAINDKISDLELVVNHPSMMALAREGITLHIEVLDAARTKLIEQLSKGH